jgi:Carbohydrate esterase, sialic acid-specific acetylesterase/SGNH hydrolase-like domain, acetyltransferase AlgX
MKKIFSLIFIFILLLPTLVWLSGLEFSIKMERIGLKAPRLDGQALLDNQYYRSFDQYFNDSFSLRSPLLFAIRWLDYHLFQTTAADDVHVGNQGWLFSRRSIEDYRKEACSGVPDIEQLVLELHAIESIIAASGRRFFFTVAPDKSTIYPEFVGFVPQNESCNRSRYDRLLEAIAARPLKGFVRLDELLRSAKKSAALLYDTSQADWNNLGALVAAEGLQAKIIIDSSQKRLFNYRSSDTTGDGDLNRHLMGFWTETEDAAVVHRRDSGGSTLPSAIIYGDAFIKNLIPYLEQMFGRLEVIRTDSVLSGQDEEDFRAGDVILLERAESELATLQIDVDKIFSIYETQARIPVKSHLDLQTIVPGTHVALQHKADGLEIKSLGVQSVFNINSIPGSTANIFRVLKLIIQAPHSDVLTVRYSSDPPLAVRKFLKPATINLYLPLPFQESVTLNIQPGRKAGMLILHSAQIYELPEGSSTAGPGHQNRPPAGNNSTIAIDTANAEPQTIVSETHRAKAAANNTNPKTHRTAEPSKMAVAPISKSPSITLNDFAEGCIFQRHGQRADIIVSGTYTGQVDAIESRVVQGSTLEERLPWTVIDPSPQNGIFVGVLANVPQGGWYNLQVRSRNDHAVETDGKHKWGVGMLIACLGQSNMKEWFYTGTDLTAHSLLRKFSEGSWSKLSTTGNAAIAFGNRLIDRLGIPIGLLDYSVNGSGLRKEADWGTGYWEDTTSGSIYNRFIAGISEAGGAVEYVIWIQGEADAARGTVTADEYAASLEHFITHQIRSDIVNGSDRQSLPFLVVMMIKRPGGRDEPHQAIRNAQKRIVAKIDDCYLAATTLDLKNHGRQHLAPGAYIDLGKRVAQTILHILGKETYHRGPQIINVKQIDSHTLEIKIKHNGGNDFKPASGITGWQILAEGFPIPIADVKRHDPQTIWINLERPLAGKADVRYLYGAYPDVKGAVLDNSPLSLPLEAYQSEIN